MSTAVSSEAWAKLRDWASVAGGGRPLLSGSIAHASLKTAVEASIPSINPEANQDTDFCRLDALDWYPG